jgi:hypothetical protein
MELPPSVTDTALHQNVEAAPAAGAASAMAPAQPRSAGMGDTALSASLELTTQPPPAEEAPCWRRLRLTVDGWPPVEGQQWCGESCTEVFYLPLPTGAGQTGAVGRCSAIPRCRLLAPVEILFATQLELEMKRGDGAALG